MNIGEPYKATFRRLGYNAKKRGIPVTLTLEEFQFLCDIPLCYYCGNPVTFIKHGRHGATNLDRKDNSKGYTFDNVVVCCFSCNNMKNNHYDSEEFKIIARLHMLWPKISETSKLEIWEILLAESNDFIVP